jgi:hypothetical protein
LLNFLKKHRDEEYPLPWKRMLVSITGSVSEELLGNPIRLTKHVG